MRDAQVFQKLNEDAFARCGAFADAQSAKAWLDAYPLGFCMKNRLIGAGQEVDWFRMEQGRRLLTKPVLLNGNYPGIDGIIVDRLKGNVTERVTVKAATAGGINTNVHGVIESLEKGRLSPHDTLFGIEGTKDRLTEQLQRRINSPDYEENKTIKSGEVPEEWTEDTPKAKHKLAQKDTDARWTKKNNETHYGYKNHAKVDVDSKIITDYSVTDASVHDSRRFTGFFNEKDKVAYADSAYAGQEIPEHIEAQICEKGYRNHPLTEEQKQNNRRKSKIRCRIEHIFGFMTGSMNGITVRTIGIKRAAFNIGLTNLIYNICRCSTIKRKAHIIG